MERKTLGCKTLWLLKRDTSNILIAESIIDALAGEIILDDRKITLCSTNGICNIEKIRKLLDKYRPKDVFFARIMMNPVRRLRKKVLRLQSHSQKSTLLMTILR